MVRPIYVVKPIYTRPFFNTFSINNKQKQLNFTMSTDCKHSVRHYRQHNSSFKLTTYIWYFYPVFIKLFMAALHSRCGHHILVLFLSFLWLPYEIGQTIIFLPRGFLFLSSFFSSPNLSGRRLDV